MRVINRSSWLVVVSRNQPFRISDGSKGGPESVTSGFCMAVHRTEVLFQPRKSVKENWATICVWKSLIRDKWWSVNEVVPINSCLCSKSTSTFRSGLFLPAMLYDTLSSHEPYTCTKSQLIFISKVDPYWLGLQLMALLSRHVWKSPVVVRMPKSALIFVRNRLSTFVQN